MGGLAMKKYDFFPEPNKLSLPLDDNSRPKKNFSYYSVNFVASLILDDGLLFVPKFLLYKDFVAELFKYNLGDDVELRVFLQEELIQPTPEPKALACLIEAAKTERITKETLSLVVDYAIKALSYSLCVSAANIIAVESLISAFGLNRSDYAKALDHIDHEKEKRDVEQGFNLLKNWSQGDFLSKFRTNASPKSCDKAEKQPFKLSNLLPTADHKKTFNIISAKSMENEKTRKLIARVIELNGMLNSKEISDEAEMLLTQIQDDQWKIVLAGEVKHGKSSLFNKILGEDVSPVGESTAMTASVVELFYSESPKYEIQWMSLDNVNKLIAYTSENANSRYAIEYDYNLKTTVNKDHFRPGEVFYGVRSADGLSEYICASGEYAAAVEKVRIGSPLECLRHGAVLIDTPGLNDPMQVRNTITLNQTLVADTLVFVLRADKIGTESERAFLENVINKGKLSELLLVITHSDSVQMPIESLKETAKEWLKRVPTGDASSDMHRLLYGAQIFAIDARSKQGDKADNEEFDNFIKKLSVIVDKSTATEHYATRAREKRKHLVEKALTELKQLLRLDEDNRYNELLAEKLLGVTQELEKLSLYCAEQINARVAMMGQKHSDDFHTVQKLAEQSKKITQTAVQTAIVKRVDELGERYSDKNKWKDFNNDVLLEQIKKSADELDKEVTRLFEGWDSSIKDFARELADEVKTTFSHFPEIRQHYESVCNSPGYILSLCKASNTFDAIDKELQKTTRLLTGAGIATALARPALIIGLVASIPVAGWITAATMAGAYALIKASNFLNAEKAKERFIDNKIEEANKAIDEQFELFDEAIYTEFAQIEKALLKNSLDLYRPLLRNSLSSSRDLQYQIQVMQKIQSDTTAYAERLLAMND